MKYLSFIVLIMIMFASQFLVSGPDNISIQTHSDMQVDLENVIKSAIEETIPNMYGFKVLEIKSSAIDDNNVRVAFTYSYQVMDVSQGGIKTQNSGHALLKRLQDNQWSLDSAQIENQKLEFSDPIIITPDGFTEVGDEHTTGTEAEPTPNNTNETTE